MSTLTAYNLSHSYQSDPVLTDISLELGPSESVALIGPNGSGKTTLLQILAGYLNPSTGHCELDGTAVRQLTPSEIASQIALMPSASPVYFDFTAREFVEMGGYTEGAYRFGGHSSKTKARATDAMETLEVNHLASKPLSTLSDGELQRVRMAQIVMSDAPIWLLDEPTSNLDPKHRKALLEQIEQKGRNGGSVIASLHNLNLVERYFSRVIVLHESRIAAEGPPRQTLSEKLLSEVYETALTRRRVDGHLLWTVD